jgi:hypothetical protein
MRRNGCRWLHNAVSRNGDVSRALEAAQLAASFIDRPRNAGAGGASKDRARVAGGQDYEVRYEAKKTKKSASAVKKAVKKVGGGRKRGRTSARTLGMRFRVVGCSRIATPPEVRYPDPRRVSAPPLGPFSRSGDQVRERDDLERYFTCMTGRPHF